jgi:hypothetical protein
MRIVLDPHPGRVRNELTIMGIYIVMIRTASVFYFLGRA